MTRASTPLVPKTSVLIYTGAANDQNVNYRRLHVV
jgi:hypothetical protein